MASIYLCQIQLGLLKLLPPSWLSPLIALYILRTDFHNTGCCFMHQISLISWVFVIASQESKKKPKPHQTFFYQHNCLCSYFLETQQYLLALSLELTDHLLGTSNSQAPVFIKSLATTGYHILTFISTFEALVILTLGHDPATTDLTHIVSILNLRQEIWDLQSKKATAERIYKIMNLFSRQFSCNFPRCQRQQRGGDAYLGKVSKLKLTALSTKSKHHRHR